jgi:hypothetical protein
MRKIITVVFCVGLLAVSCKYNNLANCYHGKVIMGSCCTGSSFISLDSSIPIGKSTSLNGQDYMNVIQVPGYLTKGEVYLNLRDFNPDKDFKLFPINCYCLVAVGMDVPVFVATGVSYSSCP